MIITNLLKSELVDHGELGGGYIENEPAVGEAWEEFNSIEHQPYSSEYECGGVVKTRTEGYVSGVVAPLNAFSKTSTRTFAAGLAEQAMLAEADEGAGWGPPGGAPAVLETTATITYEQGIMVKT